MGEPGTRLKENETGTPVVCVKQRAILVAISPIMSCGFVLHSLQGVVGRL